MEINGGLVLPDCKLVIHEDLSEAADFLKKKCPVCSNSLNLFQINFQEKFLMCGNEHCEYPFLVEDYHIFKIPGSEEFVMKGSMEDISSITSESSDWNEQILEPERPAPANVGHDDMDRVEEAKRKAAEQEQIKWNAKQIAELNRQLFPKPDSDTIHNESFLRKVSEMQERSGVQLLKKEELKMLKKKELYIGDGEVRIDVDLTKQVIALDIKLPDKK